MSITTCQKVTLISCSVLCISLFLPRMLLPRAKKEMGRPEVGPGYYPPVIHQLSLPEDPERWGVDPSVYSLTHSAEVMAKFKSMGPGKKHNLMEPDEDLIRLQQKLLQTEKKMERIVSGKSRCSGTGRSKKSKTSISKKEEKLLKQLRQITQLIQEGRMEAATPEMEAEETPYCADWEGYPEETYPDYDEPWKRHEFDIYKLEEPTYQPTAEALAERMEQEEEEMNSRKLSVVVEEDEEAEEEDEEDYPREDVYKKEEEEEEEEEEDDGTEEEVDEEIQ
ncbi:hypothetical protein F7725_026348 [Dissostichus mawsoni]|uniref:Protein RIC-3 n=1 Tax=Dissostichus mawsoni TaxID=36200 RepID=A0A7J5X764_DISMA|nr:hypothetical protein F7725_026348 [Dissostichus mawsoni]